MMKANLYRPPIEQNVRLCQWLRTDLRIKRDDLLPMSGGGNKVRKLQYIAGDAESKNCNALVTHGGVQSNHARVTALVAAEKGWRCKLVLHGDPAVEYPRTGNLLLMHLAGAEVEIVPGDRMLHHVEKAVADLEKDGAKPFNIAGGGHCLAGTLAYADAVTEVAEQLADDSWVPDTIVVASGTGATQAGIVVGVQRLGWPTRVIGVSVGRTNPRGRQVVEQSTEQALQHLCLPKLDKPVDFRDDWLCGGYERASPHVLDIIETAARTAGLILDPTYTGKAFTALVDLASRGEIKQEEKVLFWHTGGLLNLMASKYYLARRL